MNPSTLIWGAPQWWLPAALLAAAALLFVAWGYRRLPLRWPVWLAAVVLKSLGIALLAACLVEPLLSGVRPRVGENLFVLLADNSRSLAVRDRGSSTDRGQQLRELLNRETHWQTRLCQDFDVRRYGFDARLRSVEDFAELDSAGTATALAGSLEALARRYRGRPLAGVLLFTDGNATDLPPNWPADSADLPPIYPVVLGDDEPPRDVGLGHVAVTQTNFEDAPITMQAEILASGYPDEPIVAQLLDEQGKLLREERIMPPVAGAVAEAGSAPLAVRFQFRPEQAGVSFYQLRVMPVAELAAIDDPARSREATLANNRRWLTVDRGGGPYRVLYVCGRPNWEFKFLRRAIEDDPQVQLVALVRIAKREPKFDFRGRAGESTNPLFRGFGKQTDEAAESYDKPVLVRLGTEDAAELRDGFPKAPEDLFRYHALVVDDLEADQFSPDQMLLVQKFVGQRGGGFLMLGGQESLAGGKYDRTPIGDLLPVYLDRLPESRSAAEYRLGLEREGWLQPWVRLRSNEADEQQRLAAMPEFRTLNRVRGVKPGASLLASAADPSGASVPALVEQHFGKGRSLALMIGDFWRWELKPGDAPAAHAPGSPAHGDVQARGEPEAPAAGVNAPHKSDLAKTWRQLLRRLVADVPERIEVEPRHERDDMSQPVRIAVRAADARFEPLDNATASVKITAPGGEKLELSAAASDQRPGVYEASYVPRTAGPYRAEVVVAGPDGAEIGRRQSGWTSDPAAAEFRTLRPNRPLLEKLAAETGGRVVAPADLAAFVAELPNLKIPITEPSITPLWHQSWVFLLALGCLCGEWGLRRWKGAA